MKFQRYCFIFLICLLSVTPHIQAQTPIQPKDKTLADLWMDMGLNPMLIDWFNRNARPDDVARVDHVSMVDLLSQVRVGKRLIVFKSVTDVEQLMPNIADKFDIIGYNLEHGPSNRPDEIADPVGSVKRMRALADQYGKVLAFGPDREFALNDGVAIAPYVDIFVLQVQRVQTEPDTVRDFVLPLAQQFHAVNPKLQLSVQVRTEGDVVAIANLLDSLRPELDGISILTSPETVSVAQALGAEIRQPRLVSATPVRTRAAPLPTLKPAPMPTATPVPGVFRLPVWFCAGGLLVAGVVGGGAVATVLFYFFQRGNNARSRRSRLGVRR